MRASVSHHHHHHQPPLPHDGNRFSLSFFLAIAIISQCLTRVCVLCVVRLFPFADINHCNAADLAEAHIHTRTPTNAADQHLTVDVVTSSYSVTLCGISIGKKVWVPKKKKKRQAVTRKRKIRYHKKKLVSTDRGRCASLLEFPAIISRATSFTMCAIILLSF